MGEEWKIKVWKNWDLCWGKMGNYFFEEIEKVGCDLKKWGVFFYLIEGALLYHSIVEKGEKVL